VKLTRWGKKDLPYSVTRKRHGFFVLYTYESENNQVVDVLTSQLRLSETVMKYNTIRVNERVRKFKGRPLKGTATEQAADEFLEEAEVQY